MGPTQLLITDLLKSPVAVRSASGPMPVAYVPYGYRPLSTGFTKIGFTGQLLELRGGHYLLGNGYRAYNPVLMRFHSPDHLSPFGRGGINAYTYCEGDPVNWRDLSGRNRKKASGKSVSLSLSKKSKTGDLSSGERIYLERVYEPGVKRRKYEGHLTALSTAIDDTERLINAQRSPRGEPHSDKSLKRLVELAQLTVERAKYTDAITRIEREIEKSKRSLLYGVDAIPQVDALDIDLGYDQAIRGIEMRGDDDLPPAYSWRAGSF
ncbi:RHS repeat-associated core domain-containing protein [Pantoea sp. Cy-639]|uniref:RHS repeat-associated core domain-containing protein n=1 Tax=Pantoea sp. Cy-639 TaxID=2608360 RepID=UPI001421156E|nr:RHS repeat-associated core domain-containing protein [Pantoea sp. Cy-639]NIF17347.1 hypothetical protein [Pantoea sp. Cy-639]